MKKKRIIIIIIILFVLMLIPIRTTDDGGSIKYKAILYQYTKYHKPNPTSTKGFDDGYSLKILGITIHDEINTYVEANNNEHIISIISDNKKINALTGSFCYKEGICIDKVDFEDVSYDAITTYYGNKLYIDNLDGTINSIELFDYSYKKFTNTKVEYTNEYIITPSISGPFIFKINASYQNKKIEYYFMAEINKSSGENINVILELKENTLTNKGLTMIIKNLSDKDIEYGNPYIIEKYEDGFWKTQKTINDISFTLPAFGLNKNTSTELNINWEYGYGELKGKYRIVKSFNYKENDNYLSFNKYLEFVIE